MSSVIYIREGEVDFTVDQLALIHKYSDQARVWAFLFLQKLAAEQGLLSQNEWREMREKKEEVRQKYEETQTQLNQLRESTPDSPDIPTLEADLSQLKQELSSIMGQLYRDLDKKSPKANIGNITKDEEGKPRIVPQSVADPKQLEEAGLNDMMYFDPESGKQYDDIIGQTKAFALTIVDPKNKNPAHKVRTPQGKMIDVRLYDPDSGAKFGESGADNVGILDNVAMEALRKAVLLWNPYLAADFPEKHPHGKAEFKTYLFEIVKRVILDFQSKAMRKRTRDVSLDAPGRGKEEGDETSPLHERIAAEVREDKLPEITDKLQDILVTFAKKRWGDPQTSQYAQHVMWATDEKTGKQGQALKWVTRMLQIWSSFFLNFGGRGTQTAIAKEFGIDRGRLHNLIYGERGKATQKARSAPTLNLIQFLRLIPEWLEVETEMKGLHKEALLEKFFKSIHKIRKEGSINYSLLRHKIKQKLDKQLFTTYSYLYEKNFSNPETARAMKLSPPRITGLKKKIIATLATLPEVSSLVYNTSTSTSPLHRFILRPGDRVKVSSINTLGTITDVDDNSVRVDLDNGNEVYTFDSDVEKYCTLIESANNTLNHFFSNPVRTTQTYISLVSSASTPPQIVILELRPTSEIKVSARLHINDNLVEVTEITEEEPDNLISILKGHIGVEATLDPPFTNLYQETRFNKSEKRI